VTVFEITCTADVPPTSRTAVVFACDGNYSPFAQFAAAQIARLDPNRRFDICVCTTDGSLSLSKGLAADGIRLCRIATSGAFSTLALDSRRTEATYLRLALPAALAHQYSRLLYLDSDVFIQGGDFASLLNLDIGGRAIAAVRDNLQWRTPGRRPEEFRRMGLSAVPYLNAGVLLIDVAAFLEQRLLERCLEFAEQHPTTLLRNDQSLVNLVLRGDWAEISPCWNWQYTRASMLFEALEGAHIIHFIGPKKPWRHTGGALPLKFRHAYQAFFAVHFPVDLRIETDGLLPHQNRAYLRRMLVRHLLAVGRFSAYLEQFGSDLTVLRAARHYPDALGSPLGTF
jgi:Glycosyl transferase family 8